MCWRVVLLSGLAVFGLMVGAQAAERPPFHVLQMADGTTVNLSVSTAKGSHNADYDYDVGIRLTETGPGGIAVFVDERLHPVRVRCADPARAFAGGEVYTLMVGAASFKGGDWKVDLWRALCSTSVS